MNKEEKEIFWRTVQCTVEKDVIRTDRTKPFFAGDNNPNLEIMRLALIIRYISSKGVYFIIKFSFTTFF